MMDSIFEDFSNFILKKINIYLPSFTFSKNYYLDANALYLRELKQPFRLISIFHHFEKNRFELKTEIEDENNYILYQNSNINSINECLILLKKILFGFDQMILIEKKIEKYKLSNRK